MAKAPEIAYFQQLIDLALILINFIFSTVGLTK